MKIEVIDGAVLKDGENVGTVDEAGAFVPVEGLHHKTVASVQKALAGDSEEDPKPKSKASPEPAKNPELGDLTPELIDWRKENWSEDDFNALYPPSRLKAIGRE